MPALKPDDLDPESRGIADRFDAMYLAAAEEVRRDRSRRQRRNLLRLAPVIVVGLVGCDGIVSAIGWTIIQILKP